MCGIIGIVAKSNVNQALFDGLTILQHRGQDAAGMVTCDNARLYLCKNNGLVRDVFNSRQMLNLMGNMGIGHIRYPTAGCSSSSEAQPFYVNSPYGIALAHNGNLTNSEELKRDLIMDELRHINTESDSEVLLNILAFELQRIGKLKKDLTHQDIFSAVRRLHQRCSGGYSAVALISGVGLLAFRDRFGIRPIVFGERVTDRGMEYVVASESVAMDALDFNVTRDVAPGEAIFISEQGELFAEQCVENPQPAPCIFEYVYLARPDSVIDNISVYKTRLRMGEALAAKILRLRPEHDIDVVIPIPDTGRTAALPLAYELDVKYREGFIKNRYIPRTFIMPGQSVRKKSVRQKLNAIELEFRGKNVLLVDDSIVRGTTSREIVQMARDAGAAKVYFASAAPPVMYPNVYGIDIPTSDELVAHGRTEEEVCAAIGADWLIYQEVEDLVDAASEGNPDIDRFEMSVFTGEYVTGDVSEDYLANLSIERSDSAKQSRAMVDDVLNDVSNMA
ncbi:MAG: amidophosphoribosyltransferase [Gammaproteobacteria bacterium]|nr:amidophosphoribosyltransferase [Gammaproteobacteria bacterium]